MRIFFSVGEPSGDVHGANLIRHLRTLDPDIECVGFGGPKMASAGCMLLADLTQLAVMFLWSVIKNYGTFRAYLRQADRYFATNQIDAVVLIDYPGFNWLIAKRAKKHGIPVYYYGVPQMWAWAPWRIKKLRRWVDHVLCKLPFEPKWFADRGVTAHFVGHPFYDERENYRPDKSFCDELRSGDDGQMLLLLPGSRNSEVDRNWPVIRDAALQSRQHCPNLRIVVGCFHQRHYQQLQAEVEAEQLPIRLYVNRTPELMSEADFAIACSGSVSLELMYHTLPTIIVYRVSRWIHFLQRYMIRAKYITLVNLMASNSIERESCRAYDPDAPGAESVPMPEYLVAHDCSQAVAARINCWLEVPEKLQRSRQQLAELKNRYAHSGATARAADYILRTLRGESTDVSMQSSESRYVA